jgi:hypothetical protein
MVCGKSQLLTISLFSWLVADGWFVLREEYCWLVAGGWFVVREEYCWLVADKPSEQARCLGANGKYPTVGRWNNGLLWACLAQLSFTS